MNEAAESKNTRTIACLAPWVRVVPIKEQHVDAGLGALDGVPRVVVDQHPRADRLANLRLGSGDPLKSEVVPEMNLLEQLCKHRRFVVRRV